MNGKSLVYPILLLINGTAVYADELVRPYEPYLDEIPPFYANIAHQHKEQNQHELIKTLDDRYERIEKPENSFEYNQVEMNNIHEKPEVKSFQTSQLTSVFTDPLLTNTRMSLKAQDAQVYDLIELVGLSAGINFVIDAEVKGTIAKIALQECTPGHILQVICASNNPPLAIVKELDVWRVLTLNAARTLFNLQAEESFLQRVISIKHTKFDAEFIKRVTNFFHSLLFDKNEKKSCLMCDPGNRKIFVYAPPKILHAFEYFIEEIDFPIPQVRIDAVICIVDKKYEYSWGFDWSGIYNRIDTLRLSGQDFGFVGIGGRLKDFANAVINSVDPTHFAFNLVAKGKEFVNVPVVFGGPNLDMRRLNVALRAAEADAKLKILSRPTVLTNNLEMAEILIGNNIPIRTVIEDVIEGKLRNVDTINYKDVGTMIKVTPSVNLHDNTIMLDIIVEDSRVDDLESLVKDKDRLKTAPVITTIRTKNRVVMRNGCTTVIGGLTFNREDHAINRVPFLSRIPLLGLLFQSWFEAKSDLEQLIFITPTLVKEGAASKSHYLEKILYA